MSGNSPDLEKNKYQIKSNNVIKNGIEMSADAKIGIQTAIIGICFSIFAVVLKVSIDLIHSGTNSEQLKDFNTYINPILSGAIVSIVLYVFRIWAKLSDTSSAISKIKDSISHIEKANTAESKQYAIMETVDNYNKVARTIANNFLDHYINAVKADSGRVEVDTSNLAIMFINNLWEELRIIQNEIGREKPIVVDIVHTDNINFWKRGDAERSLERQSRFIAEGGVVNRIIQGKISTSILEGQTSHEVADDEYVDSCREVMDKMRDHGVNVFYIKNPDEVWRLDFCIVRLKDVSRYQDMSMVWYINKGTIEGCNLLIENDKNPLILREYISEWNKLYKKIDKEGCVWSRKKN